MNERSWLKLTGKRYRCVPLYVPIDELDPLEKLFLKVLDEEHSIARLVQMFDLTNRIVEEVLGDLIRKNRARLVVSKGQKEIHPSGNAIPIVIHQRGSAFDVWQDDATGLVMPASIADALDRPSGSQAVPAVEDKVFILPKSGLRLLDEFPSLPDAQIIDILLRSDQELRQHDASEAQLDRLADRYRVRPQTIWLPVQEAQLQGHVIQQMASEQIPQWLARVWAAALRRDAFSEPNELLDLNIGALADIDGHRVVHDWRIGPRLAKWRDAVERFLQMIPSPASGYDLREVREHEAAVRGLLLSMGGIELLKVEVTEGEFDWVQKVIGESRDWAALIIPKSQPLGPVVAWLQREFSSGKRSLNSLIVISPHESEISDYEAILRLVPQLQNARVIRRAWARSAPMVAIGDALEVRAQFIRKGQIIRFCGESLRNEWIGLLQALPMIRGSESGAALIHDDPLRHLRGRRPLEREKDYVNLGIGEGALNVTTAIDELSKFGESLLMAIVDPQELVDKDIKLAIDQQRSLGEQLPFLAVACNELVHKLSLPPDSNYVTWASLSVFDFLPALVGVLTEPRRTSTSGRIHIVTHGLSEVALWSSLVELVTNVVDDSRWILHIGYPRADAVSHNIAELLRSRIPSPRLEFREFDKPIPGCALILDDLIFLAGTDWLNSVPLQRPDDASFGFAIESKQLADIFRNTFLGATEVCNSPA